MLIKRIRKILASSLVIAAVVGGTTYAIEESTYKEEDIVIGLDAGHNLKETYKSDYKGVLEVEYNDQIVKAIKERINVLRPDIKVIETNPNKMNLDRSGRAEWCKKKNVDFIISIHQDAIGNEEQTKVYGTHAIVDKDSVDNVTTYLAKRVINDYSTYIEMPLLQDGVNNTRNDIGLLNRATELNIPAILIECGTYDNPKYNDMINSDKGISLISDALSDSIVRHVITYLDKIH